MDQLDGWSHAGEFDAALAAVSAATERVSISASALSEDGAQPHLVAALGALERALRVEVERCRGEMQPPAPAQQALLIDVA